MPWSNQGGGGPWGSGGGSNGGGGPSPWGRGSGGGGGGGVQPPNLEDLIRRGQDRFKRVFPGGGGGGGSSAPLVMLGIGALVLVLAWLCTYRVLPDEQGVVLRFGEWVRTATPGLNFKLPDPIETVEKPKVTRVNRVDVGFRIVGSGSAQRSNSIPEEALMLTGDENIVDINFNVFWVIKDAGKFLFNIRGPEATVKAAAESAMREVIGQSPIQPILAEGRRKIEQDANVLLQRILDEYGSGIEITQLQLQKVDPPNQVVDAFRDVQRARADLERQRNEAEAYRNDVIPRARGEAERLIQEAEGYKQQVVARAEGDANRFLAVYRQFTQAKDVTQQRIYLETMEDILRRTNKIIIDKAAGNQGVLPYLPLPELGKRPPTQPQSSGAAR